MKDDSPKRGTSRIPWRWTKEAQAFHESKGYPAYTMIWNKTLEVEMMDESLPKESRILAAIRRYSWGHLSDWAVDAMPQKKPLDPRPRPMTQERIGQIIGLSPASMSEGCTFLREQNYLRDHVYLYPEENLNPLDSSEVMESDSNSSNFTSLYLRLEKSYLLQNVELAKSIEQIATERKTYQDAAKEATSRIRQKKAVILQYFRDFQRSGVDPLRLCTDVQYQGENKENCTSSNTTSVNSDSNPEKFATPTPEFDTGRIDSTDKPRISSRSPRRPLKVLNTPSILERDTTTTTAETSPSSCPSLDLNGFRQSLSDAFRAAGKPSPLPKQAEAVYARLGDDSPAFLEWLAISSQFKSTQHPGGLPRLIEFFRADTAGGPIAPRPIPAKRKTNFEIAAEEMERIYGTN